MSRPTAIFAAIRGFALANSRTLLMRHLLRAGWRVVAATTPDPHARGLESAGVEIAPIPFSRGGFSPASDFRALRALKQLYRDTKPQLVHHFNAKPVLFGSLAAGGDREVRVFNTITGLGYAFSRSGLTRTMASWGYRALMGRSSAVIFQNSDDLAFFQRQGWVTTENSRLIVSSGVDTERFVPAKRPVDSRARVLMATRLIWQKGVREYVEAAERLRQKFPDVRFQLAGEWEPKHPDAVDKAWVGDMVERGIIEFLGYLDRIDEVLPQVDLFVLPSAYREGVPRVLLEAGACGVPVMTTDAPGCREVVQDRRTGRLVPDGQPQALADAMAEVLANPELRQTWGMAARSLMEHQYDVRVVTEQYLSLYRAAGLMVEVVAADSSYRRSA